MQHHMIINLPSTSALNRLSSICGEGCTETGAAYKRLRPLYQIALPYLLDLYIYTNNSERPIDALAVKKGESLTH